MNVYWCELPARTVGMSYEPPEPGETIAPCGFYVAATRGRAKRLLIRQWAYSHDYWPGACGEDEFIDVRSALLVRDVGRFVDWPEGPVPDDLDPETDPWIEDPEAEPPEPWRTMYERLSRYQRKEDDAKNPDRL